MDMAEGKDETLFWSGRLAIAATQVINSSAITVSGYIKFMEWVRDRYDAVILSRMSKN
jgi:hypothetical protein